MAQYISVCQWCGKRGTTYATSGDKKPTINPNVPGKCPSHPSGNPNMAHGAQWEKR